MQQYKYPYACFGCRKVYKRDIAKLSFYPASKHRYKCPKCEGMLCSMGSNFKAPSSTDSIRWKVVEVLHRNGLRYLGNSIP